ncbi:MAG: DUF58 domain-containing protein [Planctomycetota bacterium]|jgi:uncharacterized protein (DUF58 family)|nr:DUF58 domain-containing protein [Planctomycetota bacterium]
MPVLDNEFMKKLDQLELLSRKVFTGRLKGERRSKKRGISIEFADYRDYVAGDDLRFLDWNIYGRLDRLFLKLFMEEEDLYVYLLIDASKSMEYGDPSKLEYAKKVAAALGYITLTNMERVSIGAFSDTVRDYFRPARGKGQMWKMFDFLENIHADGTTGLSESCRRFALRNRTKGMVILLSDFLDPSGYEEGLRLFAGMKYDLYAIHILSEDEVNPPYTGDMKLVDAETGLDAEITMSGPLMKVYHNRVRNFCDGLKNFCSKRDISYLYTTTATPFDQLVLNYLKQGGLLK